MIIGLKSVTAIILGLVTVVVLSEGTDFVLRSLNVFPPLEQQDAYTDQMFAVALAYRTLAGVAGGFVTAMLAPSRALLHAAILGLIGLALSTAGAVAMWKLGHNWYPVSLAVLALPSALAGGWLQGGGK
jgi:hypothetical protein